jgi:DNA primase
MTCAEANQIALVDYLYSLGIQPHKTRNNDYWYLSRLRDEKTPLFNVNRKLNAWYDWGLGQGGNIIDFALLYHRCTVSELLKKIPQILSFH